MSPSVKYFKMLTCTELMSCEGNMCIEATEREKMREKKLEMATQRF